MIRPDPLTPCSAGDYMRRLQAAVEELDSADAALYNAWRAHEDARWRGGISLADLAPHDDEQVAAAAAQIDEARAAWHAAHAKLVAFVGAPLELVCAVEDWRKSEWRTRERCTLPARHNGKHSFETDKPAAPPVSTTEEP